MRALVERLVADESLFDVTFELQDGIDGYFVADPFPDAEGFRRYGLKEIVRHRNRRNRQARILLRANDSDLTRAVRIGRKSREREILRWQDEIDRFVFVSEFIRSHYRSLSGGPVDGPVVHNGCDGRVFFPRASAVSNRSARIRVVTHHWSSNLMKGYQLYKELHEYCSASSRYEFVFIGANVPAIFQGVPKIGPFVSSRVAHELRNCDIYVTASELDACPNHVLEGIMTGLPVLYTSRNGGGAELCRKPPEPIGEPFDRFDDLVEKLEIMCRDYDAYRANVIRHRPLFDMEACWPPYRRILEDLVSRPN